MNEHAAAQRAELHRSWYTFPPAHLREADLELGVLVDGYIFSLKRTDLNLLQIDMLVVLSHRSWQRRRVVYTRDLIVFANVGQEIVLDVIPLAEVVSVRAIDSDQVPDQTLPSLRYYWLVVMIAFAVIGVLAMFLWNIKLVSPLPSKISATYQKQGSAVDWRSTNVTGSIGSHL